VNADLEPLASQYPDASSLCENRITTRPDQSIIKAAQITKFGPPDVFSVDEIPIPIPGPGDALVRFKACGVNRMNTELRAGVYGGEPLDSFFFGKNIVLPHLPGIEPARA
jgi:hypothetical protein